MRFVVFLFGLIATFMTAAIGAAFMLWDTFLTFAVETVPALKLDESATTSMTGVTHANAGLLLVIAAAYCFLGAILALARCGKQGAMLMIVPVLFGALLNPWSLIFTSTQFFTGLLSLLVGPLPINPPTKDAKEKDEDEDADKDDD